MYDYLRVRYDYLRVRYDYLRVRYEYLRARYKLCVCLRIIKVKKKHFFFGGQVFRNGHFKNVQNEKAMVGSAEKLAFFAL